MSAASYLTTAAGAVLAFFHDAPAASADLAVLLCPPFGWDDVCSYRSRRSWAAHLAAEGHPTLRFDLPGAGDSAGGPRDPDRVVAWTEAIAEAGAWLRAESGCARVAAVGIGLGGLLAVRAAAQGAPLDDFVLWGVPARGRTLVRELRAFSRLEDFQLAEEGATWKEGDDGALAAAGFVLAPETLAGLERIDLTQLDLPGAAGRRALLLGRDGIPVDGRLRAHLEGAGVAVSEAPGNGYGAMMAKPDEARAPRAVFQRTAAWLAGAPAAAASPPAGSAPARAVALELDGLRERVLTVDLPFGRVLGVLAEPAPGPADDLCVVFLNAGAIRRIGPNRMWVEAARRWARQGVPTLRLDLEGIGDADGDADGFSDVTELYVPGLVDQVLAALDELHAQGVARRFALAGLCSGAYWAFHAAVRDERAVAALMLNPRVLIWDPQIVVQRRARAVRKLGRGYIWRRVLRGERPLTHGLAIGWALLERGARQPVALARRPVERARIRRAGGDELDLTLDRAAATDTRLLLAFSGDEPLHEELERDGRLARLDRWPNLRLEILSGPPETHTLRPLWLQRRAHEVLDREIAALREHADAPAGA